MFKRRHYTSFRRFRRSTYREFIRISFLKKIRRRLRRAMKPNVRATKEERRTRLFEKYYQKNKLIYRTETDYSDVSDDEMTFDNIDEVINIHIPIYDNPYNSRGFMNFRTEVIEKLDQTRDMTYQINVTLDVFIYEGHYKEGEYFAWKKRLLIKDEWCDHEYDNDDIKTVIYVFFKKGKVIRELTHEILEHCEDYEPDCIPEELMLFESHLGCPGTSEEEELFGFNAASL